MKFYKETNFKETPIGKIPKEWEIIKLGDTRRAKIIMGQSPPSSTYNKDGEGLPFLQGKLEFGMIYPSPTVYCSQPLKIAEKSDILISVRAPVGDVNIAPYRLCIGRGLAAIRFDSKEAASWFYFYYLQKIKYLLENLGKGSTFKAINKGDLEDLRLPFPPLSEQHGIVEVLSCVDLAIQKVDESIARAERLKKGLMQHLLTKGIEHKEYKETPIGKIPKEWDIKRLEEAAMEVIIGVVNPATPYYTSAKEGIPYFRSQNVKEYRLEPTNVYVRPEFNKIHLRSILKENDILTLQTGFIGVSCIVPKKYEGANCHSLLITRTNPQVLDPHFLCHFLNSPVGKKVINRHNSGWGRAHLLLKDFRKIEIPLPPLQEQRKIAEIFSSVYNILQFKREKKEKLVRMKRRLMDLLLTGRVRVSV